MCCLFCFDYFATHSTFIYPSLSTELRLIAALLSFKVAANEAILAEESNLSVARQCYHSIVCRCYHKGSESTRKCQELMEFLFSSPSLAEHAMFPVRESTLATPGMIEVDRRVNVDIVSKHSLTCLPHAVLVLYQRDR